MAEATKKAAAAQPAAGGGEQVAAAAAPGVAAEQPAATQAPAVDAAAEPAKRELPKHEMFYENGGAARRGLDILEDACVTFGINPDQEAVPVELLSWKFYQADRLSGTPDRVTLVTAGGVKLTHHLAADKPMHRDTEQTLRRVFNAFAVDPATKQVVELPLPDSLVLPAASVTGYSTATAHRYVGGYLRSGGATEGARRAAAARK